MKMLNWLLHEEHLYEKTKTKTLYHPLFSTFQNYAEKVIYELRFCAWCIFTQIKVAAGAWLFNGSYRFIQFPISTRFIENTSMRSTEMFFIAEVYFATKLFH